MTVDFARPVAVLLTAAACVAEALALSVARPPGIVVTVPDMRAIPNAPMTSLEASFLSSMTADDVARGVLGLADEAGPVALTPEQRARLAPALAEGAATRAVLGDLREFRRAARAAWATDGADIAALLGPHRVAALAGPPGGAP